VLTRRLFLQLTGAGAAAALVRTTAGCGDNVLPSGRFFDAHGWATIDAATGVVIPGLGTDDGTGAASTAPGAREAMAVRYIDTLLSAFEQDPPVIFGGGPASGRQPIPDPTTGAATTTFPDDEFAGYLPLSRIKEIAWRVRIYGSAATAGGDFNDAVLGPVLGWRDLYTAGIAALDDAAAAVQPNARFVELAPVDQQNVMGTIATTSKDFHDALVQHAIEGTFCAPEYGGNANTAGWQLARYDGDSIPLGHSQYVAADDSYHDRPDQPTSTPSPGAMTETFTPQVITLLTTAALGSGGMKFF
jgi:hypothetical protein